MESFLADGFDCVYYNYRPICDLSCSLWIAAGGPHYIPYLYRGKKVDTWHGVGTEWGSIKRRRYMLQFYSLGLVSSTFYKNLYGNENLAITGFPRCDLIDPNSEPKKIVLYAPSYQNLMVGGPEKDPTIPKQLSVVCSKYGYQFVHRKHIAESDIKDKNNYPPIEEFLNDVSILITDYSSIAADFALLKRPILFVDRGIDQSKFVFPLSERYGIVTNEIDATKTLEQTIKGEVENENEGYISKIFDFQDQNNTERVVKEIKRLMK